MFDVICGYGRGIDGDSLGVIEVFLGESYDAFGEGGGEHEGLPVLGDVFEDGIDLDTEAHVEHAIGFVEDEEIGFVEFKGTAV